MSPNPAAGRMVWGVRHWNALGRVTEWDKAGFFLRACFQAAAITLTATWLCELLHPSPARDDQHPAETTVPWAAPGSAAVCGEGTKERKQLFANRSVWPGSSCGLWGQCNCRQGILLNLNSLERRYQTALPPQ